MLLMLTWRAIALALMCGLWVAAEGRAGLLDQRLVRSAALADRARRLGNFHSRSLAAGILTAAVALVYLEYVAQVAPGAVAGAEAARTVGLGALFIALCASVAAARQRTLAADNQARDLRGPGPEDDDRR